MEYLLITLIILSSLLWVWALYDINVSRLKKKYNHSFWIFLIIIFPVIGPIIYFQLKKR